MISINRSLGVLSLIVAIVSTNGYNQSRFDQRIINGVPVNIRNHKYYVYLAGANSFCGGVLVHVNKVITAAHCGVGFRAPLYAYPGLNSLREISSTRRYVANRWFNHDQYRNDFINDLCVVILTENVVLSDKIGLIPLARNPPPINSYITLVGHGAIDCSRLVNGGCVKGVSDPLLRTDMMVIGFKGPMIVVRMTPNRPCKGDSGGPWTYRGQLVAVESHSQGSWCSGSYNYEASTMLYPMPQFLAKFGIYPQ